MKENSNSMSQHPGLLDCLYFFNSITMIRQKMAVNWLENTNNEGFYSSLFGNTD